MGQLAGKKGQREGEKEGEGTQGKKRREGNVCSGWRPVSIPTPICLTAPQAQPLKTEPAMIAHIWRLIRARKIWGGEGQQTPPVETCISTSS